MQTMIDSHSPFSRREKTVFSQINWGVILIYSALVLIGWVNIYAAVFDEAHAEIFDISRQYGKQLIWIGVSFLLGFCILLIDSKFFTQTAYIIYILMMLALLAVLLTGTVTKGSKSWFLIGSSFKLQPSEFAKFATVLALAKYLGTLGVKMKERKTRIMAFVIIALPCLLVLLQNDTGSSLVFLSLILVLYREGLSAGVLWVGLAAVLLFIAALLINQYVIIGLLVVIAIWVIIKWARRHKKIPIVAVCVLAACGFVLSVDYVFDNVLEPHQKDRIEILFGMKQDPKGVGYNVNQSKIAIGSGRFLGKGFREGTQTKYNFVPEQSTDFIFCTIGEEWGFAGSAAVIVLYVVLFIRLVKMAERQRSDTARIYGYGVASILFIHFSINIGMTLGLLPVIGIPLPFISYGGSSLLSFTLLLFIFIRQDAVRTELI